MSEILSTVQGLAWIPFAVSSQAHKLEYRMSLKQLFMKAVAIGTAATAGLVTTPALAGEATLAIAVNFLGPAKILVSRFEKQAGHRLTITFGSTALLYVQIKNGAPFDVFLAADQASVSKLEAEGMAVPDSRFTYAVGRLVLWSRDSDLIGNDGVDVLRRGAFRHLAIANPKVAPYGAAAQQVLERLGLWDAVKPKIVEGMNIGQTFEFVSTGNAELGFVALSQLSGPDAPSGGSRWEVPSDLFDRIRQDAVLLKRGKENGAARSFLDFLRGPEAAQVIKSFGYELADE